MTLKTNQGKYKCSYCGKEYQELTDATSCLDSHDILYVQLSRVDLNRLIQFIMLKNDELLTPTLMKSLYKYMRRL